MEDCLVSWEEWWRLLTDLDLPWADKGKRLFAELKAAGPDNRAEASAGHGMFTCGQVLLHDKRTITIDWDTFNLADPSHDVARFLVDLKRMALKYFGSIHALDWAAEVFLKAYTAAGGAYLTPHLAFQQAAICLERAKSDVDKQVRGWGERAEMMLDEGLRILDQGPN
jgi:aminoglycoside phosphotransferase (APT) family kinase protein